jgi:hypothetical protein
VAVLSSGSLKPPAQAVVFGLMRLLGPDDRGKRSKVTGEPLEDGTVPDRWAVAEFSPQRVLDTFGPDHYRVDWYGPDGKRIKGQTFRVAHPPAKGAALDQPRRGRPSRAGASARRRDEDDDEPRDRGAPPEHLTFREFLAMQAEQRREDDARRRDEDQRRRDEAAAAQQRDREFMATILGALVQTRQQPEVSSDLLRRELSLQIRQEMQHLREDLAGNEPDEPDDTRDPPEDVGEGVARVGSAILGELEARAPHLVNELIPEVAAWIKSKGFVPSPEVQAQLARQANGRGHAGQS